MPSKSRLAGLGDDVKQRNAMQQLAVHEPTGAQVDTPLLGIV
jgi:hypothetical protein